MTSKTIVDLEMEIAALKGDIEKYKEYGTKMTLAMAVLSAACTNAVVCLEVGSRNARQLLPPAGDSPFRPGE